MHAVIDARTDQQGVERLDAPATRSPPQHWLAIINPSAGHHTNGWLWKMGRRMQRELGSDVAITRNYVQIAEVLRGGWARRRNSRLWRGWHDCRGGQPYAS
ncbi:hypothetical protein [Roseiflexus castenholzii]|uniref:hypothetical protein n=1 Tax=Roseiflexus castenholzii TaxID=120962 RepID=UPI003C7E0556